MFVSRRVLCVPTEVGRTHAFLQSSLGPFIGASRVALFGSSVTGLWTDSSDVDVTCVIRGCSTKSRIITRLRVISDFLQMHQFSLVSPIVMNARVPVLKMHSGTHEWDFSINNISGIENSQLVLAWCSMDPLFRPAALRIKAWAAARRINDRATGTLSTYTLWLQLVYVFQTMKIFPVFPPVVQSDPPFDELAGIERPLPFTLQPALPHTFSCDDVLRVFFETFVNLPDGAEIANGVCIAPSQTKTLVMRCPLTGKDVNTMNSATWRQIHAEFLAAANFT